jgi:multidrug efflux pump subunit AcrB
MTEVLRQNPAVASVLSTEGIGQDGGSEAVNRAKIYANLKPKAERDLSQFEFEDQTRQQFDQIAGARISFDSQGASGGGKDLTLVLKSEEADLLVETANQLVREMRQISGLVDISSSASLVKPEIQILPDPDRAADQGVSVRAIAQTASLATLGDNEANLPKFDLADRQIPIRIQLAPEYRNDPSTIRYLKVPGKNGNLVPLAAVADVRFGSGPSQIDRLDRSRQVSVGANLAGITLGQALAAVNTLPTMQNLPAAVTQEPAGDAEIMRDIFSRFLLALGTAVLMIYAVLVLLYNNFLYPFTIMAALPLSIGGALLGLMITQKSLGLFALIGIVLLMGLVTKNSILLVDYALMAKQQGKSRRQAVKEAGVTRLRPILMTSVSTIAGMIPIALEWGAGGTSRSPMAIAVIGGFTTATLLTLVIVPVIFTYIDSFYDGLRKTVRYVSATPASRQRLNRKKVRSLRLPIGK